MFFPKSLPVAVAREVASAVWTGGRMFLTSSFAMLALQLSVAKGYPDSCKDIQINLDESGYHCYVNATDDIAKAFSTVKVTVSCKKCNVMVGNTLEDVQNTQSIFEKFVTTVEHLVMRKDLKNHKVLTNLYFSPFVVKFLRFEGDGSLKMQSVKVKVHTVMDYTCLALLVSGIILFFMARNLATSVKFYYTGGVGVGILASVLIVVFILSRFVPKKPAAYSILIGGWSLGAWVMRLVWMNWQTLLTDYYTYFLWYIAVAGFLSFALCYWKGPVENPRSQNIIQWSIQIFSLFLLYNSSQSPPVSMGITSAAVLGKFLLTDHNFGVWRWIKSFVKKYIWSKHDVPRLLTEEEYRIQGELETRKALEELKQFCNSPECSPWKTMSRLKRPSKFISFMEGESHVSDAEMTMHENDSPYTGSEGVSHSSLITDDEGDALGSGDHNARFAKGLTLNGLNISEDDD